MKEKKSITIYCGSSEGHNPAFAAEAETVGREIAAKGLDLVYGGGKMGLMGVAGRACRNAGGRTVAIIPQFMVDRGWNDPDSTETIVTADMHSRKEAMADAARGIIAMPGGVGTFEELAEIITWRQLGLYHGNIVILNVAGYYDPLLGQIARAMECGFLPADHRRLFEVATDGATAVALAAKADAGISLQPKF